MAIRSSCAEERWVFEGFVNYDQDHDLDDDDDQDEALSLSDLPINLTKEETTHFKYEKPKAIETEEEEFNFNSSTNPQMCTADEVFFQGQLLPTRLSVSSENSSTGFLQESLNLRPSMLRSETLDHNINSLGRFRSISSRSSSSRSDQNSSSSSNSTTAMLKNYSRPKVPNLFQYSHPSPKPQIRISTSHQGSIFNGGRSHKSSSASSTWVDLFGLGLVRTPRIEFQDLKNCTSNYRVFVSKKERNNGAKKMERETRPRTLLFDKSNGFLGGVNCISCLVDQTVNQKFVIKSSNSPTSKSSNNNEIAAHAMREKVMMELKMKKQGKMAEKQKKQQRKRALSRYRTFEWLKELSHASFPNEVN